MKLDCPLQNHDSSVFSSRSTLEGVPDLVEGRWRLLPDCDIGRVFMRKGAATDEETLQDRARHIHGQQPGAGGLAGRRTGNCWCRWSSCWRRGNGPSTEVIDVMGRATVEAVLQMSAEQVAGPKAQGRRGLDREVYWHGVQGGRVALKERQLRVARPRLRKKRRRADESGEVEVPAYTALRGRPAAG